MLLGEVGVLLSMTGYGDASQQGDGLSVSVEVRAVNNRYLKVTLRAAEPYNLLEVGHVAQHRQVVQPAAHADERQR